MFNNYIIEHYIENCNMNINGSYMCISARFVATDL